MASLQETITTTAAEVEGAVVGFSRFEHATVGALYMLFAICGLATNLLLLITLYKDKTLLRGASSWFHITLAVSNMGVVAPAPFPASSSLSGKWLYGHTMCQAYAFEGMLVGMFALGNVFCLCVERYIVGSRGDVRPIKRKAVMRTHSQDNTGTTTTTSFYSLGPRVTEQSGGSSFYWLMTGLNIANALFWAVMPLLGWSKYALDHTGTSCAIAWREADAGYTSYMTMLSVFSFAIPAVVALIALYKATPSDVTSAQQASTSSSANQDAATSGLTESTLRGLCLTFLMLALAGWGPFAVLCVWAMVGQPMTASMLAACLPPLACKFMTSAYPIAYNIACPRLRRQYLALMGIGSGIDAKTE